MSNFGAFYYMFIVNVGVYKEPEFVPTKCELLTNSYKDLQHTETFDASKLMQSVIFIYCFDAFLDCKILYLLR